MAAETATQIDIRIDEARLVETARSLVDVPSPTGSEQEMAERMREIDPRNPEVAARLAGAVTHFRRYDDARREGMAAAMEEVLALPSLSKNTREVLTRALASGTRP